MRTTWRKYISSMQLATNGVVSSFYPLAGNEGAIGHDLLSPNQTAYPSGWPEALKLVPGKASWPSRRVDALRAIGDRKLTLAGPITLTQNNRSALVIRYPIFIRNVSATEQFGRPWPLSSCNLCYDVATGTKFWGQ